MCFEWLLFVFSCLLTTWPNRCGPWDGSTDHGQPLVHAVQIYLTARSRCNTKMETHNIKTAAVSPEIKDQHKIIYIMYLRYT